MNDVGSFTANDFAAISAAVAAAVALLAARDQRIYSQRKLTIEMLNSIGDLEIQAAATLPLEQILVLVAADWRRTNENPVLTAHLRLFNAIDRMALAAEEKVVDRELMRKGLAHFALSLPFYSYLLETIEVQTSAPGTLRASRQFFDDYEPAFPAEQLATMRATFDRAAGNACAKALMQIADNLDLPFPVLLDELNEWTELSDIFDAEQ